MRVGAILGCAVLALGSVLVLSSAAEAWVTCDEYWYVDNPISTPVITSPTASNNGLATNAEVTFTCSACSDRDRHKKSDCTMEYVWDDVTYAWSAPDGGTFPSGNAGRIVTWKAPSTPGNYRVRVTVNDVDGHTPGSDNDGARTAELTMQVIRLDSVRLYFYHSGTAYPYVDSGIMKTRAVVTATHTSQQEYRDLPFDTDLQWWWTTGNEGPRDDPDDQEPPVSGVYLGAPADWPNNWPSLNIEWRLLWHYSSAGPDANHNRKYDYSDDTVYLANSWGEDNRTYGTQGLHRLRASATIHAGVGEEHGERSVTSLDKEVALRICPKAYIPKAGSAMRRSYIEWVSTYVNEPYEWGGEGFGGKDSNGQWAGGADTYDGYGIDCSGLVSCGAERAGYNWDYPPPGGDITWRVGTWALAGDYCSDPVAYADFDEGDIIVSGGVHVVSCSERKDEPDENEILITHASGSGDKVLDEWSMISDWIEDDYIHRRLEAR